MDRCVYCQAELDQGARVCRACGRLQPAGAAGAPAAASGAPTRPCPHCGAALPLTARFCPNCGRSLSDEIRLAPLVPGFGVPESLPGASSVPTAPAWPQAGAPNVPSAYAGPQGGAPGVPSAAAGPQAGAPGVPHAPWGPQGGAPGVPTAPGAPQGGFPHVPSAPNPPQAGAPSMHMPPQAGTAVRVAGHTASKSAGRSLGSKLLGTTASKIISTVVAVAVVATGSVAIAAATGHNPLAGVFHSNTSNTGSGAGRSPTPTPLPPPEVTYIGGDGNIWDMTLPKGTPKQLTTDAVVGNPNNGVAGISYSGLAWSPDGKQLAAVRSASTGGSAELFVLKPDGTLLWKQPMPAMSFGPALWSPDGKSLAYRVSTDQFDQNTGDFFGNIVMVDAQTGATEKTVTYNDGPGGCGGGGYPSLQNLISAAHHANGGIDTFSWSPDGQEMLVAYDCLEGEAALVTLSNGTTTVGYPEGASFQPGGHYILGTGVYNQPLQLILTDLAGKQVRVLASRTGQSGNSPTYAEYLGLGAWSSDGQTVYYEYQDGIWRVKVDGSGAQQIIAGTQISNGVATAELNPSPSPDGKWLLYLKASGDAVDYNNPATAQWEIAQADGSGAVALPQGAVQYSDEAIWRPEK